ncbi:MAG TPA: OmpA family protein [Blastocatellia bacterium]|nr:OmpA family protein [Blastocatellia bacterium]
MTIRRPFIASALAILMLAGWALAQTVEVTTVTPASQVMIAKRMTLAVNYPEGDGTEVNMVGTALNPQAMGKAEVKRKEGRTRVKLRMESLAHPQSLGAYYTTHVLWAIAPEGQAENLAELPIVKEFDFEVTTSFQTFGLIITAEPHSAVRMPSPIIIAENALRRGTEGTIEASRIEYSGDAGTLYVVASPNAPASNADYNTPLMILGARRAVEIARRADAERFAEPELRQAEIKLAALEQHWPRHRKDREKFSGLAHDVMRLGEQARKLSVERAELARLEAERSTARTTIIAAQGEADRAREEAAAYRDQMARAEQDAALARDRAAQAQTEAERAKANEELARAQAERARLEADQAKRDKEEMQQRLFVSLSEILETRREARGLIVSLSDVLFDFNKASLKPGAREKLAKLAGILLAYPGNYRIEIEGHTDAVGTDEYNLKLSQDRAESVRYFIVQSGIAENRILGTRGFGEVRPVATNDTPEGRQMNRRVEIVIAEVDQQ